MVVLPAPDGAENIISLPDVVIRLVVILVSGEWSIVSGLLSMVIGHFVSFH